MHFSKAAIVLVLSTAILGAKPPPPPSTNDPQVGYIKILNNGTRELRVANEDGTGSVLLASTGSHSGMTMSLGPKSLGLIAYAVPGQIRLLRFVKGPTGIKKDSDTVIASSGRVMSNLAFSPTGERLAWLGAIGGSYGIHVYDLASGSITNTITSTTNLSDLDFSADGSSIIYSETLTLADTRHVRFRSAPADGGAATDLGIEGLYGSFSVGPADEIVADTMGEPNGPLWLIASGSTSPVQLTNGYAPAVRCDSRYVILQRIEGSATVSLRKYEVATGLVSTFSTSGNYWPDYFPDC